MAQSKWLMGIILFNLSCSVYGQQTCSADRLTGTWRQVLTFSGESSNVDSLKNLADRSVKMIGSLEFRTDGTYKYRFYDIKSKKYKRFTVDSQSCEIILGERKNARKEANLKIIFLDHQYLFFCEDNNPKTMVTHLFKKEG